jgi:hypothetical protein
LWKHLEKTTRFDDIVLDSDSRTLSLYLRSRQQRNLLSRQSLLQPDGQELRNTLFFSTKVGSIKMCFCYRCDTCKKAQYEYCDDYKEKWFTGWKCCNIEHEKPWGSLRKRCRPCTTIVGAIEELKALVFREPWLETEGMAGAPEKAAWEMEGEEVKSFDFNSKDGTPDGFSKEEREKIRRKAEEAVARRWGLLAAEQAAEKEEKAAK